MKTKGLISLVLSIITISAIMASCSDKTANDNASDKQTKTSLTTMAEVERKEPMEILTEYEAKDTETEFTCTSSSDELETECDPTQESNLGTGTSIEGEDVTEPEWEEWQSVSADKKVNILNLSNSSVSDFRVAMPNECKVYGDNYYVTTDTGKVLFSKSGVDNTLDEAVLEKRIVEFVKYTIYNFNLNLDIDYDSISITDEFVNGIETKCFTFASSDVLVLGYVPIYEEYSGTTFVSFDKNGTDSLRMLEKILITGEHVTY